MVNNHLLKMMDSPYHNDHDRDSYARDETDYWDHIIGSQGESVYEISLYIASYG